MLLRGLLVEGSLLGLKGGGREAIRAAAVFDWGLLARQTTAVLVYYLHSRPL